MENTPHIVHSHTYAPYPYTVRELDRFFVVRAHQTCIAASRLGSYLRLEDRSNYVLRVPSKAGVSAVEPCMTLKQRFCSTASHHDLTGPVCGRRR